MFTLAHERIIEDLIFLDDQALVTACEDGKLRFWSLRDGSEMRPPIEHSDAVLAVDLSPDGRLMATGSRDMTARFWETATGQPAGPILNHANWVEDIAFFYFESVSVI